MNYNDIVQSPKLFHSIMLDTNPDYHLDQMEKQGILYILVPGLQDVVSLKDSKNRFKDLWRHTKQVVAQTPPKLELRWAALFHDFGKPATFKIENDVVSFHNHEQVSVSYFMEFAKKYRIFTPKQFNTIKFLIRNLGYVESYDYNWSDSAVRRFYKKVGKNIDDLIELSKADVTSQNSITRKNIDSKINNFKTRIEKLKNKDNIKPLLPKGLGNALMEIGIFGKDIEKIKKLLENQINENKIQKNKDIKYYKQHVKNMQQ